MVTAEEAASALGVIGLVVLVGMAIYNIERAFANPDSTITEKVSSLVLGINPIATLVVSIGNDFGPSPYGKVRNKIDDALTDVAEQYSYTISKTEAAHLELFTSMVEKTLINAINNTAVIKKTYANYSKILLRNYAEEYLVGVKKMHDNLSKIYAKQWMKASPYFIALNTTLDNAVKGEEIAPPKIISSQTLTLCGVDDDHYFLNFKGKNSRQIKRCLEGVFYDYKAHFKDYTLYDEITISAPDLEQKPPVPLTALSRVVFKAIKYGEAFIHCFAYIFDKLSCIFLTPTKYSSAQTTLDNAVKGEKIAPPKIISSQTLTLCGVDDDHYFLNFKGKNSRQIKRCLEGVFYDRSKILL
jgi:hypothetical protein